MDAQLSICIPTRNRCDFLAWTLDNVRAAFPNAEIIVSDNCSTDGTRRTAKVGPLVDKLLYMPVNKGAFPNMYEALAAAERKYAVFCADDDYLVPERVHAAVAWMDDHPEVAAYCAPCESWNEVEQKPYWNAWGIPQDVTYARKDAVELFNMLINHHVWPEHFIYRLPLPLKPRTRAYWAFVDLADILDAGPIHFANTPYYRNIAVHPVGWREQLGNQQCLTHFDEYRGGLEVLAFELFGHPLTHTARRRLQDMIGAFICTRMDLASKLYIRQGNETDAVMLKKRIAVADPRPDVPNTTCEPGKIAMSCQNTT